MPKSDEDALTHAMSDALGLMARGANMDAAQLLEAALTGERRPADDAITPRCVLALQVMLAEMPQATRTAADVQALLGALMFAAHLGADVEALADVVSPKELAVTLARILHNR